MCKLKDCPEHRRLSFSQEPDIEPGQNFNVGTLLLHSDLLGNQLSEEFMIEPNANGDVVLPLDPVADKPELTCISEEGIADMDLPDNILDDLDYIGDHITSCNKVISTKNGIKIFFSFFEYIFLKVENYLMLSEFENNLNIELPSTERKGSNHERNK